MNCFKKIISVAALLCLCLFATAQQRVEKKKPFKDRLFTGGHVGLTFGSYTNVIISPMIGARLNEKIYAGLGIEYQYTKYKDSRPELTFNQYGGRMFTQYNIVPKVYAHGELACYSMERYTIGKKERSFVPFIYVGGGYRQMISERAFFSVQILFDVLQHTHSPYKAWEPIYSVGFGIGI